LIYGGNFLCHLTKMGQFHHLLAKETGSLNLRRGVLVFVPFILGGALLGASCTRVDQAPACHVYTECYLDAYQQAENTDEESYQSLNDESVNRDLRAAYGEDGSCWDPGAFGGEADLHEICNKACLEVLLEDCLRPQEEWLCVTDQNAGGESLDHWTFKTADQLNLKLPFTCQTVYCGLCEAPRGTKPDICERVPEERVDRPWPQAEQGCQLE
jgi:hypothetical protein